MQLPQELKNYIVENKNEIIERIKEEVRKTEQKTNLNIIQNIDVKDIHQLHDLKQDLEKLNKNEINLDLSNTSKKIIIELYSKQNTIVASEELDGTIKSTNFFKRMLKPLKKPLKPILRNNKKDPKKSKKGRRI